MTEHAQVPPDIIAKLNAICLGLPEAWVEPAWTGTRWMVGKKNFAHAVMISAGWPLAYARAAGSDGPLTVLTFRLPVAKLASPRFERPPFFRPVWFPDIAGMAIDTHTDWDEVSDVITESYCVLAPKKLARQVDRPDA